MGRIFQKRPQAGQPLSIRGLAAGLAKIDYALTNMAVENGSVEWSALGAPTLFFGSDGAGSSPGFIRAVKRIALGGLPSGGYKYQALTKASDDDYDADWDWLRYVVPE